MYLLLKTVLTINILYSSSYITVKTDIVRSYPDYDSCHKAEIAMKSGSDTNYNSHEGTKTTFNCEEFTFKLKSREE